MVTIKAAKEMLQELEATKGESLAKRVVRLEGMLTKMLEKKAKV